MEKKIWKSLLSEKHLLEKSVHFFRQEYSE